MKFQGEADGNLTSGWVTCAQRVFFKCNSKVLSLFTPTEHFSLFLYILPKFALL